MFETLIVLLIVISIFAIEETRNKLWAIIGIFLCWWLLTFKIQQQIDSKLEAYCITHQSEDICAH